ncbi:HAD family hydrolase [Niallia sp. Krafla_26]|uniref:HAD family hydrolase n=1 Tax=Niallia sp. Krafla_26 TaxID=3064703 RepID=UPI003D177ABE
MFTFIFDLDDTLYDRTQPLQSALLDFPPAENIPFDVFLKVFTKNSDIAFDRVREGVWSLAESHIYRIKETLAPLGIHINEDQARVFQQTYQHHQQHIELYPAMSELLNFLKEKDIQPLIITNGPAQHQRTKIKNLGLDRYFTQEQVIISGEEGIAKPDVRIFEIAQERFQFQHKDAWYIGDSFNNDIVGASRAGWKTIWLTKDQQIDTPLSPPPTKTVSSPMELKEYILRLVQR